MPQAAAGEDSGVHRALGNLEGRIDMLESRFEKVDGKLDTLLELANKAKGGWIVIIAVAGAAGTAAGTIAGGLAKLLLK